MKKNRVMGAWAPQTERSTALERIGQVGEGTRASGLLGPLAAPGRAERREKILREKDSHDLNLKRTTFAFLKTSVLHGSKFLGPLV